MPSMLTTAIHNTFIKGAANLTAQLAVQWNATDPQPLDLQRILEFAIFGFIGAHIGYIWHHFLERQFPTHTTPHVGQLPVIAPGEKDKDASAPLPPPPASAADPGSGGGATKVSWKNVMAKVIADQTVGLCVMITTFLIITNIARVPHLVDVFQVVEEKLWRLVLWLSTILASARLVASYAWSVIDINNGEWSETVKRDVCIVGGGASGVHAAVSLLDLNKTVVVVERNNVLGGHTHTYIDPKTQIPVDIGVIIFHPIPAVFDFFNKFNVPLVNMSEVQANEAGQPANLSVPAAMYNTVRRDSDFRDGSEVTLNSSDGLADALQRFAEVLSQYPYLLDGYDLPDPVPEDLYLPFGAFVEKYNLTDALPLIYQISQGMGDLLHVSTIYAIKYFNLDDLQYMISGYFTEAQGNNSLLYTRAGEYIGASNVLLESSVVSANRQNTTTGRPELLVSTPDEGVKLLSCGQILLTIPPALTNLRGWDLTPEEYSVFSQYITANGYWTGLVQNVGLNQTESIYNSAQNTFSNIPVLPALYYLTPTGVLDDVWYIKFSADNPTMTEAQVKSYAERQINRIQDANNVTTTKPEWLVFESHTPFHLQVAPEAIRDGFFSQLTALQGGIDGTMFYSGAVFHTQHSSLLWEFNEEVAIPKMVGSA
ncbi:putative Amine oxidase domain-containing protein [Seiridium cardinale]|uniref:Amine oxidase domain-containing protein n=1 Tax=Seiridium cardinale TaxID=138064 RepID=A0ABR2Y5X7_9PEZI